MYLIFSFVPGRNWNTLVLESSLILESSVLPLPSFVDVELLVLLQPGVLLLQGLHLEFCVVQTDFFESSAAGGPDWGVGSGRGCHH